MAHKHALHAPRVPSPATPAPAEPDDGPLVPDGESSPAYRWAFNAFAVLFLVLVCAGLLNYLGWYLKARTG